MVKIKFQQPLVVIGFKSVRFKPTVSLKFTCLQPLWYTDMSGYIIQELSRDEVDALDSVKILEKVAYAQESDKSLPAIKTISILTTDDVVVKSFFESFFRHGIRYGIFLRHQESGKDPFGFMLYSVQDEDEAMKAFRKITATLAPMLDAGFVTLNKELLKEIILPVPKEPEQLTFDIIALMKQKPHIYPHWIKLLKSLLEFASRKDDDKAVTTLLGEGADPKMSYGKGRKQHSLMHSLVRHNSKKTIAALCSRTSSSSDDVNAPDCKQVNEGGEKNEEFLDGNEDDKKPHVWRHDRHKTRQSRKLSYVEIKDLLNVFDDDGATPLMLCVTDLQIDSTLQLLMGGADPNIAQPSTGDTALHLATQLASVQLVKLVVAYGGNISSVNKKSQTPMDIAKEQGDEEIVAVLEEVKAAEDVAKEAEGTEVKLEPGSLSLLSLDGGGIRAMMTAQVLVAIQKRMKALDPSCKSIMDYFDYVAGTSMGATIVAGMLFGNVDVSEVCHVLFSACDQVFSVAKQDRRQKMESLCADLVGADTKMSKRLKPRLMMTSTIVNRSPCALHLFTNFGESDNDQPSPEDQDVVAVLCASMAAPYHFPPYKGIFADGGVAANNPTLAAMAKIVDQTEKEKKAQKIGCVVSLGTGVIPEKVVDDIDMFIPSLTNAVLNIRGKLNGVANLLDILVNKAMESDGQPVIEARAWCKTMNIPYFRISPYLPCNVPLNSIDRDEIITLIYAAHIHVLEQASTIETIALTLLTKNN